MLHKNVTFAIDNASNAKSTIKITSDEYCLLKDTADNPDAKASASNDSKFADEIEVVAEDEGSEENAQKFVELAIDDKEDVAEND